MTTVCPGLMRTGSTYNALVQGATPRRVRLVPSCRLGPRAVDRCAAARRGRSSRPAARRCGADRRRAGEAGGIDERRVPGDDRGADGADESAAARTGRWHRIALESRLAERVAPGAVAADEVRPIAPPSRTTKHRQRQCDGVITTLMHFLLVAEGLVHLGRVVEPEPVGDDERRVDLPLLDALEQRAGSGGRASGPS